MASTSSGKMGLITRRWGTAIYAFNAWGAMRIRLCSMRYRRLLRIGLASLEMSKPLEWPKKHCARYFHHEPRKWGKGAYTFSIHRPMLSCIRLEEITPHSPRQKQLQRHGLNSHYQSCERFSMAIQHSEQFRTSLSPAAFVPPPLPQGCLEPE